MARCRSILAVALLLGVGAGACQRPDRSAATREGSAGAGEAAVAARVGDRAITLAEVDRAIESELARIEVERYRARKAKLDELIDRALIERGAKEAGLSPEEFLEKEVAAKVEPPSEQAIEEVLQRFERQGQPVDRDQMIPRIRQALTQQAFQAKQQAVLAELRRAASVQIALEPPRIRVETAGGIQQGPADAPITLVEFSDYQCPFCARSQATVKEVLEKYRGRIRHVFMDFPLEAIHPQARSAASAARCAHEQGKFWEYHSLLYERQRELSPDNYRKWAEELSLDGERFDACLASGKYDATIQASLEAGRRAGVTGTPGFFVNGIPISGAQPFAVFEETIEGELSRG